MAPIIPTFIIYLVFVAVGPEKLAGMITKLGGDAEHSCGVAGASPASAVALDQGGQFATCREPLQGVGKQGQSLGALWR